MERSIARRAARPDGGAGEDMSREAAASPGLLLLR